MKLSKTEIMKEIGVFFSDIGNKTPKEVKKIRILAMSKKIPLKDNKKLFCKKCLTPYTGSEKIRIKGDCKSVECKCGTVARWKIK